MKIFKIILSATLILPVPAYSQGLLGNLLRQSEARARQQNEAAETHRQVVARVERLIVSQPDEACKLPQSDIQRIVAANAGSSELRKTVAATVFFEDIDKPPQASPYDSLLARVDADTRRRAAQNEAMYAGRPAPVGDISAPAPQLRVEMSDMRAIDRIDNGLRCSAKIAAGALRFPLTYSVTLDPGQSDGWGGQIGELHLTEAYALEHPDRIKIAYDRRELSLVEARAAAKASQASDRAFQRQLEANTPRSSPAADRGCRAIEPTVAKIIEDNSQGIVKVIEVSTVAGSAGARADGTLSCSGIVITNRGEIKGTFGTSRTPKGQLLVRWWPN